MGTKAFSTNKRQAEDDCVGGVDLFLAGPLESWWITQVFIYLAASPLPPPPQPEKKKGINLVSKSKVFWNSL